MKKTLTLTVFAASLLSGCAIPVHQQVVDREVDRLCAEPESGIHVYEQASLAESQFDKNGYPDKRTLGRRYGPGHITPYYKTSETVLLRGTESNYAVPYIKKYVDYIYDRTGNKLLGKHVYYVRIGGDSLPLDQPSSHGCPQPKIPLEKQIFKEEDKTNNPFWKG